MLAKTVEFVVSVALLVGLGFGLYYLDKHTGGNVAGPDGFVRGLFKDRPVQPGRAGPAAPANGPEPVHGFTASFDTGAVRHQFEVENESSAGDLSDVQVQLTFHPASGSPVEVKERWGDWKRGERKVASVRAAAYVRVELKGTARAAGREVALASSWTWNKPTAVPPVRGIDGDFSYGLTRHRLEMVNGTEGGLTDVDVRATFHPESGAPVEVKESWADWPKGAKRAAAVRADRYKRVELKGTAKLDGHEVTIDTHWTWNKPYRPAVTDFGATVKESGAVTFTNHCKEGTLRNVQVTLQLTRSDGVKVTLEATWPDWHWEESKTVAVPFNKYRGYSIKGRASIDSVEVPIDDSGSWTWR